MIATQGATTTEAPLATCCGRLSLVAASEDDAVAKGAARG